MNLKELSGIKYVIITTNLKYYSNYITKGNMKIDWKIKTALFSAIGGAMGFAYYYYIGCNGGCLITGNPYISTVYGSLIGFILGIPTRKKVVENGKEGNNQGN